MLKRGSFFVLLAAALLSTPCARAHHAPGPIKIVAILTLSGPAAGPGAAALQGLQIAVEAIKRVTSSDYEAMRRSIELTAGLAGLTGSYRMWPDNHTGLDDKALLLLQVKDGAFRIAD